MPEGKSFVSIKSCVVKESFHSIMLYTIPPIKTNCLADKVGVIPPTHTHMAYCCHIWSRAAQYSLSSIVRVFKKINMALFSTVHPLSVQIQFHKPILLCYLHERCSDKLQCGQHRPLQSKPALLCLQGWFTPIPHIFL